LALFKSATGRPNRAKSLQRVTNRDWEDRDEMNEALRDLSQFKDLKADEIVPLLTSSETTVRFYAERLLKERHEARLIEQIYELASKRTTRAQSVIFHATIRATPQMALTHLERIVREGDKGAAQRAMEAISSMPAAQIGREFMGFLEHSRPGIRYLAIVKIGDTEDLLQMPAMVSKIVELAEDEDERIRLKVLEILAASNPAEAVRVALMQLKSPEPTVQQQAVRVLSQAIDHLGTSESTEDELLSLLTDGSEAVRSGVIEVMIGRPDQERILRKLLVFCKHLMGWMRDRTLVSLRTHSDKITGSVVKLMDDPDEDVRSMALMLGATLQAKECVPHIVKLLDEQDWWLRMIAAETLGKIGDIRAVAPLLKALADPTSAMVCLEALARIGDKKACKGVISCLSSPQPETRAEAIRTLVRLQDSRTVPAIEACAKEDPSPAIRERAEHAIKQLTGKAPMDEGSNVDIHDEDAADLAELGELERMLVEVREKNASDLHVVVDAPPVARINGALVPIREDNLTPADTRKLVMGLLNPLQKEVLKRDTQVDFCHSISGRGRYRANAYVERKGLSAAFRLIPQIVPTLSDIGLPSYLADLVNYRQGLVLVAGPSGSGKSTTLAALVNLFNERRRCHVLLLEDPIEFVHSPKECLINQREVRRHTEDFASALRGALRQDPDVIVVGEMRDPETVKLAIEASETGHLVIGTMNTNSAPKTIDRVIDNFPIKEQAQVRMMLAETVKMVICQSLVPAADGETRIALFEVMMGTLDVRNLIKDNKTYQIYGQMQVGKTKGHQTVDVALERLLDARRITPEQAWLRAQDKEVFEHRVSPEFLAGQTATE